MPRKKKNTLPSGNVRLRVYVGRRADGTLRYESFTGPDKREITRAADEYRERVHRLLAEGYSVDLIPKPGEDMGGSDTVGSLLEMWLDTCRVQQLSPSTLRQYAVIAKKSFSSIASVPVRVLTLPMIQAAVNQRYKAGRSPKTIRNEIAFLNSALKQARPDLRLDALRLPTGTRQKIAIPSSEDMIRILEAAEGGPMYVPICLAAFMGLRRSEICGLRWNDINLKERTLHVHSALVRGESGTYVAKGTKTRAGDRILAIPSALVPILANARGIDPRVTQLTPAAITCRYEEILAALELTGRFHDLRHFHASAMIAAGAPDTYIMADMGHASMDMVRRVYGHVMEERRAIINQAVDEQTGTFLSADMSRNMSRGGNS